MASKKEEILDLKDIFKNSDLRNKKERYWLDTGFFPLNKAISGEYTKGICNGKLVEVFGSESTGKTALCTQLMIEAQKQGGIAIFLDYERSFDVDLAEKFGLDLNNNFSYEKPETAERGFDALVKKLKSIRALNLIREDAPIICVIDSFATMLPESAYDKKTEDWNMSDNTALSRIAPTILIKLKNACDDYNATALIINQTSLKIGVLFGSPETTPGGIRKNFMYDLRLRLSRKMLEEKSGQNITIECIKNKMSAPFKVGELTYVFNADGSGYFDILSSTLDYIIEETDKIQKVGHRIVWDGKNIYKSELLTLLRQDPDGLNKLNNILLGE